MTDGVSKFRRKSAIIEAMQMPFDDRNGDPSTDDYYSVGDEMVDKVRVIAEWMFKSGYREGKHFMPDYGINYLDIETLEGDMRARPGDWIIKGIQGEFYPCRPDIFEATYEKELSGD